MMYLYRTDYGRKNRKKDKKRDTEKEELRLETCFVRDWSVSQHRPRGWLKY